MINLANYASITINVSSHHQHHVTMMPPEKIFKIM